MILIIVLPLNTPIDTWRTGDEEAMTTEKMKKLSPPDPVNLFKVRLSIELILKPDSLVTKVLKILLSSKGVRAEVIGDRSIKVNYTFRVGDSFTPIIDAIKKVMNCIEILCYEASIITRSISLDELKYQIIKETKHKEITILLVKIDAKFFWLYINKKRKKVVLKPIMASLNTIQLDPSLIPQTIFIKCIRTNREEALNKLAKDLEEITKLIVRQ